MAYDLEEQEKLDALKAWWARYGMLVTIVLAIAAVGAAGWSGWRAYQSYRANQAMGYFEALEDAARLGGADSSVRIKAAAATLREQYGSTGYATRGVLVAACEQSGRAVLPRLSQPTALSAYAGAETADIKLVPDLFGLQLLNHSVQQMAGVPIINLRSSPLHSGARVAKAIEDIGVMDKIEILIV